MRVSTHTTDWTGCGEAAVEAVLRQRRRDAEADAGASESHTCVRGGEGAPWRQPLVPGCVRVAGAAYSSRRAPRAAPGALGAGGRGGGPCRRGGNGDGAYRNGKGRAHRCAWAPAGSGRGPVIMMGGWGRGGSAPPQKCWVAGPPCEGWYSDLSCGTCCGRKAGLVLGTMVWSRGITDIKSVRASLGGWVVGGERAEWKAADGPRPRWGRRAGAQADGVWRGAQLNGSATPSRRSSGATLRRSGW